MVVVAVAASVHIDTTTSASTSHFSSISLSQPTMNTLLQQVQQPSKLDTFAAAEDEFASSDPAAWGSMAGFGNLSRTGSVAGMSVPRVHDVSFWKNSDHRINLINLYCSLPHSLTCTPTQCLPTQRPRLRLLTARQPSLSVSREVSLSLWILGLLQGVMLVSMVLLDRAMHLMTFPHSFRHCQEGYRNQQIPARNHGRWCGRLSILVRQ